MTWKRTLLVLVVLAVSVGIGWTTGLLGGDPEVAQLTRIRDEAFKNRDSMSAEERREKFQGFGERVRNLSDDQRRDFFRSSRPMFQQMMVQRMNDFFESSPEEQRVKLDEIINRIEERRAEREAAGDGPGAGRSRGNWGNQTPEQRDQRRKERLDRSTPEMRARMDQFKDKLNKRREERGLPPVEGFRGMFGRLEDRR